MPQTPRPSHLPAPAIRPETARDPPRSAATRTPGAPTITPGSGADATRSQERAGDRGCSDTGDGELTSTSIVALMDPRIHPTWIRGSAPPARSHRRPSRSGSHLLPRRAERLPTKRRRLGTPTQEGGTDDDLTFIRPSASSRSMALSSSASANSRLSRVFSDSSSLRRLASEAFIPPYWESQRCQVDTAISRCLQTSPMSAPPPRRFEKVHQQLTTAA